MDNEVPVTNGISDGEDGVSLVDSVSNGLHRSLFTDSEGYFSRYRYAIKPFKYPLSISFGHKAFTDMILSLEHLKDINMVPLLRSHTHNIKLVLIYLLGYTRIQIIIMHKAFTVMIIEHLKEKRFYKSEIVSHRFGGLTSQHPK